MILDLDPDDIPVDSDPHIARSKCVGFSIRNRWDYCIPYSVLDEKRILSSVCITNFTEIGELEKVISAVCPGDCDKFAVLLCNIN